MDGIKNEKDYVAINAKSLEEKIAAVEKMIKAGEDKVAVRKVFKELKTFARTEYEVFHKRKYFGTYIFENYHPLVEGVHIEALGETRVNASIEAIENAITKARYCMQEWSSVSS